MSGHSFWVAAAFSLPLLWARTARADLTLEDAVRATVAHNERAGVAERTREAVAARITQARAAFLPQATLTATYTRRSHEQVRNVGGEDVTIQSANALSGNLTASISVFDARNFPLYRQALRESEAQDARSADSVRLLGFEAADSFLNALGAAQVVEAARRRVALALQTREVAQARLNAQLGRGTDVTRADLEVASAEQALTQAQGALDDARLQLAYLTGVTVEGTLVEPADLMTAAAGGAAGEAVARLDLRAARLHAAALREFAREPLMRYIPNLVFSGQARATNEAGLNGRTVDWSLSLLLTWHLFDGGLALGDRRERTELAAAAELEAAALARGADSAVARARAALAAGQAGGAQAAAALAAAQKNAREVELLYRQGLAASLEVADANNQLFEAEVAAIRARYTVGLAYLDLRAALGQDAPGGSR